MDPDNLPDANNCKDTKPATSNACNSKREKEIPGILHALKESHTIISFFKGNDPRHRFSSYISEINQDQFCYRIEMPDDCLREFFERVEGHKLRANCNYEDDELVFEARFSETEAGYQAAFPVTYRKFEQRRRAYRINVGEARLTLINFHEQNLAGNIRDISVLGVRAEFATCEQELFSINKVVDNCKLELTPETIINCGLRIKRIFDNNQAEFVQIAAEFIDLGYKQEVMLSKYIFNEQRRSLTRYINR